MVRLYKNYAERIDYAVECRDLLLYGDSDDVANEIGMCS